MNGVALHMSVVYKHAQTPTIHAFSHYVQGKLHGIISCESGKMEGLKSDPIAWSTDVKKLIALCHGLVPLSKGKVVGRVDEQKAFACVEAAFLVSLVLHMCLGSKCCWL